MSWAGVTLSWAGVTVSWAGVTVSWTRCFEGSINSASPGSPSWSGRQVCTVSKHGVWIPPAGVNMPPFPGSLSFQPLVCPCPHPNLQALPDQTEYLALVIPPLSPLGVLWAEVSGRRPDALPSCVHPVSRGCRVCPDGPASLGGGQASLGMGLGWCAYGQDVHLWSSDLHRGTSIPQTPGSQHLPRSCVRSCSAKPGTNQPQAGEGSPGLRMPQLQAL